MNGEPPQSQAETRQIDFSLAAGEFGIRTSARVPTGETNPTQLLPILQQVTNEIMSSVGQICEAAATPVSCRTGCAACCRQLVPVSLFEAEALAEWMASLPEARQRELLDRFSAGIKRLRESGLLAEMGSELWTQTPDESELFMTRYEQLRIACPFLENESCGIYPIRPLICREYVVISPPEFCGPSINGKVIRIDVPIKPSNALIRMASRIDRNQRGWIPLIFLASWMNGRAAPGEAFSGTGPQVLRAFIQHLSPPGGESSSGS